MDRRRTALLAIAAALAAVIGLVAPGTALAAPAAPAFAPAADAVITPGVLMLTPADDGTTSVCTAAFVFAGRGATYLGYAAHCAGTGDSMGLSGCVEAALPVGTGVVIEGNDGSRTSGRLAYTSWGTMQERGDTDEARCTLNDFALVELDPDDVDRVNPSVPLLGGPTDVDSGGPQRGDPVYSYQPQNSSQGVKEGRSLGPSGGGLGHRVDTSPPGRPGDSGSGYMTADGEAFGVLSTLYLDGSGTNGVTDLASALAYAGRYGGIGRVSLVPGTESFGERD